VEATTVFAQTPSTPEAIVARVRDDLARACEGATCPPAAELERLADAAVRELWESRVKTFVTVLAVRQAREMLVAAG
jgi:hypothetical protein